MAKSSRGRGRGSSGSRHKSHSQKSIRSLAGRASRRNTQQFCVRRPGRLARERLKLAA